MLKSKQDQKKELVLATVVSSVPEKALYCKVDVKLEKDAPSTGQQQPMINVTMPQFETSINIFVVIMALLSHDTFTDEELLGIISPEKDEQVIQFAQSSLQFVKSCGITSQLRAINHLADNFVLNVKGAASEMQTSGDERIRRLRMHLE